MSKINDISGQTINNIRVLSFSHTRNGRSMFNCLCHCGEMFTAIGKNIRNNKSCRKCVGKKIILMPKGEETGVYKHLSIVNEKAVFDACFYDYFSQFKWRINKGYAVRSGLKAEGKQQSNVFMHQEIINAGTLQTDHINGNKLDNRLKNLRPCTRQQNLQNTRSRKGSKIPFKGVYKNRNAFVAQIKGKHIGVYQTPEDAAKAYNCSAQKEYGEFARLNDV